MLLLVVAYVTLGVAYYPWRRMLLLVASCDRAAECLHQSVALLPNILAPSARDGLASVDAFAAAGARVYVETAKHLYSRHEGRISDGLCYRQKLTAFVLLLYVVLALFDYQWLAPRTGVGVCLCVCVYVYVCLWCVCSRKLCG